MRRPSELLVRKPAGSDFKVMFPKKTITIFWHVQKSASEEAGFFSCSVPHPHIADAVSPAGHMP